MVNKALVCSRSESIAGAFRHERNSNQDNVVDLTDNNPDIVRMYVNLLHYGKLPVKDEMEANTTNNANNAPNPVDIGRSANIEYTALCKFYVICDKMLDRISKNMVIQAIMHGMKDKRADGEYYYPTWTAITYVYKYTSPGNALRVLLADCYVEWAGPNWLETGDCDKYPADFCFDVMLGVAKERMRPVGFERIKDVQSYIDLERGGQ